MVERDDDVDVAGQHRATLTWRMRVGLLAAATVVVLVMGGFAVWALSGNDDSSPRVTAAHDAPRDRSGSGSKNATTASTDATTTTVATTFAEISGTLLDGRPWTVRHDPEHGLCVQLAEGEFGCDDAGPVIAPDADPATARTMVESSPFGANQSGVLSYAYLPQGASDVVLLADGGREVYAGLVVEPTIGFWAMPITPGDNPQGGVLYRASDGSEVLRITSATG